MDEVVVVHKSSFQKRSHFLHGQKPCWSWRPRPGGNIFFPFFLACNFLKDDGSHRKTDQRWWTAFAWFSTAFFPNVIFFSVCVLSKLSTTLLIMWRLQISKCSRADKKERTAFPSQSQVLQHYLQLASPFSTQPWWHFSQSKVMKCNQSGGPYSFSLVHCCCCQSNYLSWVIKLCSSRRCNSLFPNSITLSCRFLSRPALALCMCLSQCTFLKSHHGRASSSK